MSKSETTAEASQPSEEAIEVGGMEALRDALKDSLSPQTETAPVNEEPPVPEPEPEPEQQPEPEQTQDDTEPPEHIGYQKRINRLTAQKKELEERMQELEETTSKLKLETKKTQQTDSDSNISELVLNAQSESDLEKLEDEALAAERWAKRALARYRRDPDQVEREIENRIQSVPEDPEAWLEDLALNAEWSRESDIPKRRKQIIQNAQSFEFAAQKYPWLREEKSPARAWVEQVKEANPGIQNLPDVDLYLARALVGFYIEQEQAQKKQPAKAKTPDPTPQPGAPAAQKASVSDAVKRAESAKSQVFKDLLDLLTRVDEKATPFMSLCNKGTTPRNTYIEWPVDNYDAPQLGGVVDGTDVSTYGNPAENRALLSSYLQTFRKTAKVSRLAQDVSDVAGVSDEIAEAIAKVGVELLRNIESTCLSDQEHQADDGTNPYLLRGLGVWEHR